MKNWYDEVEFGFMMHFGLYSLLGGEYKGRKCDVICEWIQNRLEIPNAEYEKLAEQFNPVNFDAEDIVKRAKKCGMKYVVLTSKHHEGFALFHSEVDKFNIYDASPCKRDLVAELADACRKYDMKLGLYYSQDLDWHEPDGGGHPEKVLNCGVMNWDNRWDYPDIEKKDYAKCFERKIKPQLTELLTKYGEISLIWFDTPKTINKEQSAELRALVKKYQPNCVINTRIGNGYEDYTSFGDNEFSLIKSDKPWEMVATMSDTWGFRKGDKQWRTPKEIQKILSKIVSRGGHYLLNVGPDETGALPEEAIEIMDELAAWMEQNQEAILGAKSNPYPNEYGFGPVTSGEDCVYLHLHQVPESGLIALGDVTEKVSKVGVLGNGQPLAFSKDRDQLVIQLFDAEAQDCDWKESYPEDSVTVIKVCFEEQLAEHTNRVLPLYGAMSLSPCDGKADGNISFRKSGSVDDGWMDTTGAITYELLAPQAGKYHISMVSGLLEWKGEYCKGNSLVVTVNGKDYEFVLNDDHLLDSYLRVYYVGFGSELGEVELKEGLNTLSVRVVEFAEGNEVGMPLMSLMIERK